MKCDNVLHKFKLSPSILAADFTRIGEMVQTAENAGVDYIHIDVMDGHFVKPITMGERMISAIRNITKLPLDIHMMVNHPENHYKSFIDAGADLLTIHEILKGGCEVVQSLQVKGVTNISVPILDHTEHAIAAVTIPYLDRINKNNNNDKTLNETKKILLKHSLILSKKLGYKKN